MNKSQLKSIPFDEKHFSICSRVNSLPVPNRIWIKKIDNFSSISFVSVHRLSTGTHSEIFGSYIQCRNDLTQKIATVRNLVAHNNILYYINMIPESAIVLPNIHNMFTIAMRTYSEIFKSKVSESPKCLISFTYTFRSI